MSLGMLSTYDFSSPVPVNRNSGAGGSWRRDAARGRAAFLLGRARAGRGGFLRLLLAIELAGPPFLEPLVDLDHHLVERPVDGRGVLHLGHQGELGHRTAAAITAFRSKPPTSPPSAPPASAASGTSTSFLAWER